MSQWPAPPVRRTTTDNLGGYRIGVVPNRPYRVTFELQGFDLFRSYNVVVPPDAVTTVAATLPVSSICECVTVARPPLMERSGRVIDDTGRPLAGARLELGTSDGRSVAPADGEGRFRVRLPVDTAWPLTVSDSGFESVTQRVSGASADPILFTLPRTEVGAAAYSERFSRGCRCPGQFFVHAY